MEENLKKLFGARVKYYRNLIGFSQEKLAEKVGISTNTLGYIERGKNNLSAAKLPALCNALKIKPYLLFIDTDSCKIDTKKIDKINELLKIANDKQLGIILNIVANILDT